MRFALPVRELGPVKVELAPTQADQVVQLQADVDTESGSSASKAVYTVPAGERLLIQYLQGYVSYPSAAPKPEISVGTTVQGNLVYWRIFTPTENVAAGGFRNFAGASEVTIYADPGSVVEFTSAPGPGPPA